MSKLLSYSLLLLLVAFSFYYTERAITLVQERHPMYQSLKKLKAKKIIPSQNALINDNEIIPGLNGLTIDVDKSFLAMRNDQEINQDKLVYQEIEPSSSLKNNLDKIIIAGHSSKQSVAIITSSPAILDIFLKEKLTINFAIEEIFADWQKDNVEYIINAWRKKDHQDLVNILNYYDINHRLCLVNIHNTKWCRGQYNIKPSLIINRSNFVNSLMNIKSGDIIFLSDIDYSLVKLLIKQIKFQDLKIMAVSELISEKNIVNKD